MTAEELWEAFIRENHLQVCEYDTWAFGVQADYLAQLVVSGMKTATSSAYSLYEIENEPLPQAGAYSVVLDSCSKAVCVIQTKKVTIAPMFWCSWPPSAVH